MSSLTDNYKKWNKLDGSDDETDKEKAMKKEEDGYTMTIQEELMLQPPFKYPIEFYKDEPGTPIHRALYQMRDSGWSERCIDFKLQQIVHYSDEAIMYRTRIAQKAMSKIKDEQVETQKMLQKMRDIQSTSLKDEVQHGHEIEEHFFPDHHKRSLDDFVGEQDLFDV